MKTKTDVDPQADMPGIAGPEDLSLIDILNFVAERNASDLHLVAGGQPFIRINGDLFYPSERFNAPFRHYRKLTATRVYGFCALWSAKPRQFAKRSLRVAGHDEGRGRP